ncbi:hypothetical protein GLOIN_2v1467303 [Rhizophagus irregularis DAOM 181602=DAOM 197198]|uniref:DUF221-domain-containing protein n=1 Tax=Rhizophagus irregularis (strain DAOM 181602 / DAOM 197198 / MUCL 43194) TaxID=747089 RepID=A0A2P4P2A2_RHIID|nr:hypothetical protein GLOIN_2v1467303 [Rhizophagus irregularis DAOM 181602=DAOM 197198]POG59516.1 hypothetical protein GLOIN_2v1467303 [Rhizophagus irregularis DAOM 181602=DAOM 197198]|eukprot:XP_025166382.1 hypothetical protein GLOIN_2v1467303 [Rhizophagus irregularis DAOM 181602=DAOM 197198]
MSIVPPEKQSIKISLIGIVTQFGINLTLGFGTLVLFSFLRPRNVIVYSPKQFAPEDKQPPKIEENKLWGWVKPVLEANEKSLVNEIGLDAVMFIRFIKLCQNILLCLLVFGACVIMPINIFGTYRDNNYDMPSKDNPLQILSVSYLEQTNWFWAHSVFTWLFSLIIYWFIFLEYKNYNRLRIEYFKSDEYRKSLHSKTLLITGLPNSKQSDKGLVDFMESIKVRRPISEAVIARDIGKLPDFVVEREAAVRGLESAFVKYLKGHNKVADKRPEHRMHLFFGAKVDSITFYTNRIETTEARISELRKDPTERKALNYGFVSFESIYHAHSVARQLDSVPSVGIRHESLGAPAVHLAPIPKDIIWGNLSVPAAVRKTQRWIGRFFFVALCFLWLIPLGFITTAGQIRNIVKIFPFLKDLLYEHDFIAGLIESWMTPMVLALFVIILPIILRYLTKAQGIITYSETERSVLGKLYLFFFINNLILYTISSTVWDIVAKVKASIDAGYLDLDDLKKNITNSKFLDEIAESAIKVSFFWINYISLSGLFAVWDLAQLVQLIYIWFKKKLLSPTPRNLKELSMPPDFDYPVYYNTHLFFFTLGILYSVIAPLILVFCYLYYVLAYLVYRYVFNTKIETGGVYWKAVFNRLIVAIIFWQLTMIGVMNLKGAHIQSVTVAPLIFLTLMVKLYCTNRFDQSTKYYVPDIERAGKPTTKDDIVDKGKRKEEHVFNVFGHPALTAELIVPMIHANAKNQLKTVYKNSRITEKTEPGKSKPIILIEEGDHVLKIQPVERSELYIFNKYDFNVGYTSAFGRDDDELEKGGSDGKSYLFGETVSTTED